ncbi:YjbF family lipoprotein [Sulfitobacter sp. CW3]|uniref:YjbF family lipoprotein n=1 Tax=Sulfitobacter sp. CW3 TaxID=2861965 RepID=UPI001C5D2082|nr:YjbF family lipoprotein [Sulfitobacter sp. CW3]MBW4962579.1 YjbF family lipoprotein [Sulfitobacter sp. CW3]
MIRHVVVTLLTTVLLSACTAGESLIYRGLEMVEDEPGRVALPAGQFPPRFAALVADTSVPLLVVTIESSKQGGRLLLENSVNDVETWLSADMSALMIQNGIIRGTRGVGSELFASDISEPMNLILSGNTGYSDRFTSNLGGDDRIRTRTYRCLVETKGSDVINLEIGRVATRVMTEDCKSMDQSFTNTYWVSSTTGAIVQSRQWAGDDVGYMIIQVGVR